MTAHGRLLGTRMLNEIFKDIGIDTIVYYVLVLGVYVGLISWLSSRLTQSRADMRRDARQSISENLGLIEMMRRVRAEMADTEAKSAEIDQMMKRLMKETSDRIHGLNDEEDKIVADPAEQYLILPPPLTALGAVLSFVFGAAVFFAGASLLFVAVGYANGEFDPVQERGDLRYAAQALGVAVAAGAFAFLARFAAYQSFKARLSRLARRGEPRPPRRSRMRLKGATKEEREGRKETRSQRKLRRAAEKAAEQQEAEAAVDEPPIDGAETAVRRVGEEPMSRGPAA